MNLIKGLIVAIGLSTIVGCGNTLAGATVDTKSNIEKTKEGLANLTQNVQKTGSNLKAASTLTPKVQKAIDSNAKLHKPTNSIKVSSSSSTVTLEGHVTSQGLKSLASHVAKQAMNDLAAKQTLENKLVVGHLAS